MNHSYVVQILVPTQTGKGEPPDQRVAGRSERWIGMDVSRRRGYARWMAEKPLVYPCGGRRGVPGTVSLISSTGVLAA